jgi:hypothetical protein
MGRSVEQKRKSRNLRKKRKRAERYKSKREEDVQTRVEAIVRVIRKDFDKQKRIASKYYNKWKQCMLDANNNFKKSESPKVNQLCNNLLLHFNFIVNSIQGRRPGGGIASDPHLYDKAPT